MRLSDLQHFTFSGGEVHFDHAVNGHTIVARITSSDDLIALGLLQDKHKFSQLVIPYFPYSRQDRQTTQGSPHSLRFMCRYLNMLGFEQIVTHDLHSEVAFCALPNLVEVSQHKILSGFADQFEEYDGIVSPDAGAVKKVQAAAIALGIDDIITGSKIRDPHSGEIYETRVDGGSLAGRKLLIVDDICDGGRTFIELAKALREKGAVNIGLYITHGIFSKGMDEIFTVIDTVYTTNTFRESLATHQGNMVLLELGEI